MINIKKFFKYLFSLAYKKSNQFLFYKTWQQKMLWFIHWEYVKKYKEPFFKEDFIAYSFGPMNWDIFWEQNGYYLKWFEKTYFEFEEIEHREDEDLISFLKRKFYVEFNVKNKEKLWDTFLFAYEKYSYKNPKELVDLSHKQKSWINNKDDKKIIKIEDILVDDEIK